MRPSTRPPANRPGPSLGTASGAVAVLVMWVMVLGAGCGYSSRRLTEVAGARTIAVSTFSNAGYRRDLELRLTQAVLTALRSSTSYAIGSPTTADLVLSGTMNAEESVIALDENDNPIQKRLYGQLKVTLTERATGRVVKTYLAGAQTEYTPNRFGQSLDGSASDEWVRRVAERVVQGLEQGF